MAELLISLFLASSPLVSVDLAQTHAEREAKMMADRRICSHLLGVAPTARFSGVGRSTHPQPKTCLPWEHGSGARQVIADATVRGSDGFYYRSRHWK
jgi:hypothetical protein